MSISERETQWIGVAGKGDWIGLDWIGWLSEVTFCGGIFLSWWVESALSLLGCRRAPTPFLWNLLLLLFLTFSFWSFKKRGILTQINRQFVHATPTLCWFSQTSDSSPSWTRLKKIERNGVCCVVMWTKWAGDAVFLLFVAPKSNYLKRRKDLLRIWFDLIVSDQITSCCSIDWWCLRVSSSLLMIVVWLRSWNWNWNWRGFSCWRVVFLFHYLLYWYETEFLVGFQVFVMLWVKMSILWRFGCFHASFHFQKKLFETERK